MAKVTINTDQIPRVTAGLAEDYYRRNYSTMLRVVRQSEPRDTGLLRAATSIDPPRKDSRGWYLRFRAHTNYARVVHEGHGWIFPKVAKALRWVNKQGVVIFAQRVRPVAANPYFFNAFRRLGFKNVRRNKL
jgi:hypothetical protein